MAFNVCEGDANFFEANKMDGAVSNVEVWRKSERWKKRRVVHPFVHSGDKAFVVAVECEAGKWVVVGVVFFSVRGGWGGTVTD